MPEMSSISNLLKNSRYGIKFLGDTTSIINQINKLEKLSGVDKTVCFIQVLNLLAVHEDFDLLSSVGFVDSFKMSGEKNLGKVYEFIIKNFKENISLNDVAKVANMNPSAFSRFFKRVNRKTYSEYLNGVRVGYACKLLIEEKYNISEICFDSGFNNVSNFNRQFKKTMNYSPSDYMKLHLKKRVGITVP
jgi:AraC-like DNA-binding protein